MDMFNLRKPNCQKTLIDKYGRRISSLRISITSRCNLNCIYCHREGEEGNSRREISKHAIFNIISSAIEYGASRVKFTGGEPLMRSDLEEIIASLPKLDDVSMTTNGVLLSARAVDLAESGLHRVNISLPSLCNEKYNYVTKSRNKLPKALDGIHCAVYAGLSPVKINVVLLKSINDGEVEEIIDFARDYKGSVAVQLIELMDFNGLHRYKMDIDKVEEWLEARASKIWERSLHRRRKYLIGDVVVELVRPVNNSRFCANCNRLRVTSDGRLKPCLMRNDNLIDISNATAEELHRLLKFAVSLREPYYKESQIRLTDGGDSCERQKCC